MTMCQQSHIYKQWRCVGEVEKAECAPCSGLCTWQHSHVLQNVLLKKCMKNFNGTIAMWKQNHKKVFVMAILYNVTKDNTTKFLVSIYNHQHLKKWTEKSLQCSNKTSSVSFSFGCMYLSTCMCKIKLQMTVYELILFVNFVLADIPLLYFARWTFSPVQNVPEFGSHAQCTRCLSKKHLSLYFKISKNIMWLQI